MEKNYLNKKLKSYTLVEILVVMVIFAVIAGLGFAAVSDFRKSLILNSASSKFETTVKTVQNNARNNVISKTNAIGSDIFESKTDSYILYFANNEYEVRSCTYDSGINNYRCLIEPLAYKIDPRININSITTLNGDCEGIFYENLTGNLSIINSSILSSNILTIDPSIDFGSNQQCQIDIQYESDTDRIDSFLFDKNGNVFKRI